MKTESESASWLICVDGPTVEGTDSHQFDFEVVVSESQVKRLPEVVQWVGPRRITVAKPLASVVPFIAHRPAAEQALPVTLHREGDRWAVNVGGRLSNAVSGIIRFRADGKLDVEVDQ